MHKACGQNGKLKSNSQTTVKAIQGILHGIRFVSERLELLELTDRATTSKGKPVSILRTEFFQGLLFRLLHDFCTDTP